MPLGVRLAVSMGFLLQRFARYQGCFKGSNWIVLLVLGIGESGKVERCPRKIGVWIEMEFSIKADVI